LALLSTSVATANEPKSFVGFRLLDLQHQTVRWQTPRFGEPASVSYAFVREPMTTPHARNCAKMLPPERAYGRSNISDTAFRHEVSAAFRMWERVANISFHPAADTESADILIGAQAEPVGRAFTNVALKPSPGGAKKVIARSLICLNPRQPWKVGFDGNLGVYDLRYTIAHEIGHAIGLDHPSAAGQLMSYRYDEKQNGLQAGDVKGAALLYGVRPGASQVASDAAPAPVPGAEPDAAARGFPFGIGESDKRSRKAR
jgi:hypothetical protein